MKISHAAQQFKAGSLDEIQVRKNPNNINQWFVMIRKRSGDLLMLADEHDEPIVDDDLTRLMGVLKSIGCKEAKIFL